MPQSESILTKSCERRRSDRVSITVNHCLSEFFFQFENFLLSLTAHLRDRQRGREEISRPGAFSVMGVQRGDLSR
jgi:hypothetical protein